MNTKEKQQQDFVVTVKHTLSAQSVSNLLVSAFEGGSNYWASPKTYNSKTTDRIVAGELSIQVVEDCGEGDDPVTHVLDRKAVERGLQLFAELKPGRHFQAFISENDDAETGDVFLQMCLLGKIVYG